MERLRVELGCRVSRTVGGRAPSFAVALLVCLVISGLGVVPDRPAEAGGVMFAGPVPRADCGPGSQPETGLQGQVPLEDRRSGRSAAGYRCNLDLVGQHQGEGASIMGAWYGHCYYHGTSPGGVVMSPGVQVIDASEPKNPKVSTTLVTPAMAEPSESLKAHEGRGLLAAVQVGLANPSPFEVYDVKSNCTAPRLLGTLPLPIPGHEGTWTPDGKTYWAGVWTGGLAAVDVSEPRHPRLLYVDDSRVHGLSFSADGNTAYLAVPSLREGEPNGLRIVDVSEVQARRPVPRIHTISTLYWTDGGDAQVTIPIKYGGRPFLIFTDEAGSRSGRQSGGLFTLRSPAGATRIIEISDLSRPRIVSNLKLEIQLPEHAEVHRADTEGNGVFGYQAHYCSVDRDVDPTALACSYFQSGIRVFDIRNPYQPREIAYFNPPAQIGKQAQLPASVRVSNPVFLAGSVVQKVIESEALLKDDSFPRPNLTADWCMSQVRFYKPRNELWTHCTDNGFMVLKLTNGAYPLPPLDEVVPPRSARGSTEAAEADLATMGPDTSAGMVTLSPAIEPAGSPTTPRGWSALSPRRLQLVCIINPQLDERSAKPAGVIEFGEPGSGRAG